MLIDTVISCIITLTLQVDTYRHDVANYTNSVDGTSPQVGRQESYLG